MLVRESRSSLKEFLTTWTNILV